MLTLDPAARCCRSTVRARHCLRSRRPSLILARPAAGRLPNPFYRLAGGRLSVLRGQRPQPQLCGELDAVLVEASGQRTQLLFVCSPGNPTGAGMPLSEWKKPFELSDRYGFGDCLDEYSETYFRDEPPLGGLQAAARNWGVATSRTRPFDQLLRAATCPACAAALVAGDAAPIKSLFHRTHHTAAP